MLKEIIRVTCISLEKIKNIKAITNHRNYICKQRYFERETENFPFPFNHLMKMDKHIIIVVFFSDLDGEMEFD